MSRYIDADALLQKLSRMIDYCKKDTKVNGLNALFQVGDAIMDCPTADVVEVVRCKDCIKRNTPDCAMRYECSRCGGQWSWETNYSYCSYGERKEK